MVRTLNFHCKGTGSIPGQETKIPQALAQPEKQSTECTHPLDGVGGDI